MVTSAFPRSTASVSRRCRFSSVATVDATGAGLAHLPPITAVGWELLGLVAALPIADEAQRDGGAAIPEALREPRGVGASSEREAISSGDHVSPLAGCHAG
jgi:hypothetical protein